jgi:predicted RNA-binding Zn-ribbon protein involved in translation (DUF1610 family)
VNDRFNQLIQYNIPGIGCWLTIILFGLLLGSIGLGGIVNGFLILLGLLLVIPVITIWVVQWWLRRNLVQSECPVCRYEFTGFKNTKFSCPNCGEPLQVISGKFSRIMPPGTIDVNAVEVTSTAIEEDKD